VLERQRQELLAVHGKEGRAHDQKRVGTAVDHGGEGRVEGGGCIRLHALELHAQRLRFPLEVAGHVSVGRLGWIDQDCYPGDRGHRLLEQLEPLPRHLDSRVFQPGEVALRSCHTCDEPLFHQPIRHADDDGNGRGGALGRLHGVVRERPEDIWRELDQLRGQSRKPVAVPLGIAIVEEERSVTKPPTVLYHIGVSSSRSYAARILSIEAERRRRAAPES